MNKEEQLALENKENYELYLKRMTESMNYSTKGLIPYFASKSNLVLDVGCGSGVMLKSLLDNGVNKVIGIDNNRESIKKIELLNDDRISLYNSSFDEFVNMGIQPDTVIFSAVLHEVSSYHNDEKLRYSLEPIKDTLKRTYNMLPKGGKVIIRDCIMVPYEERNKKLLVSFNNFEDSKWLYRFKEEFLGFKNLDVDMNIEVLGNNLYKISYAFLKEFLYTYTWGEESWNREITERVGIMDQNTWESMVIDAGFEIENIMYSKEEYEKYLSPKINIKWADNSKFYYPYMNVIIVGVKK